MTFWGENEHFSGKNGALCCGLPVHFPYIVITCARIDSIKRVCNEPPCCPGASLDLLSVHDNFGDEDGILRGYFTAEKVKNSLNKIHTTSEDAKRGRYGTKSGSEHRKSSEVRS